MPTMAEIQERKRKRREARGEAEPESTKPVDKPAPKKTTEKPESKKTTAKKTTARKQTITRPKRDEGKKPAAPPEEATKPTEEAAKKPKEAPAKKTTKAPEKSESGRHKFGGIEVVSIVESIDYFQGIVFGIPGVGKTFLSGTAGDVEEMCPILFIDIEGGTKTLRNIQPDIEVLRVADDIIIKNGKPHVRKYAWQVLYDVYEDLTADTHYKTVIVDSLSEAYELNMAFVLKKEYERAEDKGRDKHEDVPEQRDWQIARSNMRKFVKAMKDLDKNIIFTAQEQEVKDQKTGAVKIMPMFPGKLPKDICSRMDEVYYLYTKTKGDTIERLLLTQPEGKYYAKTRSADRMPLVVENPTMEFIYANAVDHGEEKAS